MKTDLSLVQHLLRHLNDTAGLRQNPLSAPLLLNVADGETVRRRIRSCVTEALASLLSTRGDSDAVHAKRQYAIIYRCDVNRESHSKVAADLGLSMRQFYRERRAATQWLSSRLLTSVTPRVRFLQEAPGEAELRIEIASGLRNYGRFNEAVQILRGVVASGPDPTHRLAAAIDLVETIALRGRQNELMDVMVATRKASLEEPHDSPLAKAQLQIIEAFAASANGRNDKYAVHLERALKHLSYMDTGTTHFHLDAGARASLLLAQWYLEVGDMPRARRYLDCSRNIVNDRSGGLRKEYRVLQSSLAGDIAVFEGRLESALEAFAQAVVLSQNEHLPLRTLGALQGLSVVYHHRNDAVMATSYARSAHVLAETLSATTELLGTFAILARLEIEHGDPKKALRLIERAQNVYTSASEGLNADGATVPQPEQHYLAFLDVDRIAAFIATGQLTRAIDLANDVRTLLERQGRQRDLAAVHYMRADIYNRLNRRREAIAAIECSVDIAERFGSAYTKRRAHGLAGNVTGSAYHRLQAKQLSIQLSS